MKKKLQYSILLLEAMLCTALAVLPHVLLQGVAGALTFPFELLGFALRTLSLSGFAGNSVALFLYAALCLSPVIVLLARTPKSFYPEDTLALLLSLSLFVVLYQMINPGDIAIAGGFVEGLPIAKAVLGGTVYSVLVGYLILRMLRIFWIRGQERAQHYLYGLLFLLIMLFVASIFGGGVRELLDAFAAMKSNNSGNEPLFCINSIFIVLRFVVTALPSALNISIIFSAMSFLQAMAQDQYSGETVARAKKLTTLCAMALAAVVVSPIAFNVLQLLFASMLFNVNSSLQVPLFSIVFVPVCLVCTRLVTEGKALKDDNDSII